MQHITGDRFPSTDSALDSAPHSGPGSDTGADTGTRPDSRHDRPPDGPVEVHGCLFALSQPPLMVFLTVVGTLILLAAVHDLFLL